MTKGLAMEPHYATKATGTFNGQSLSYDFLLDLFPVKSSGGAELGAMSVFSYIADSPRGDLHQRPVIFIFNGGPGGSSSPLHLSGIGPKRAVIPEDLSAGVLPPYRLENSSNSILDVADLVFMDPIGTGYGTVTPDVDLSEVLSVEGDARYFAKAIERWVATYDRWDAPKYLLGESYGTHRAPFIAAELHGYRSVPLSGIVLLGQALNVQETMDRPGNITAALAGLPLKAATAWYHKRGSLECASAEEATRAAIDFAYGEYAKALLKGNTRSEEETALVAERLSVLTGIPAEKYVGSRLWETKPDFSNTLLPGRRLGGNDTRYVGDQAENSYGELDVDPATTRIMPSIQANTYRYFASELGVPSDAEYQILDFAASNHWDWSDSASAKFMRMGKPSPFHTYPYPARLTTYLRQVPEARLFIGTGMYDALTTVGAVEHLLRQYPLPLERITSRWYEGGHMMYTDPGVSETLNNDLRVFVDPQRG